ncbi:MAG: tRNA (adenosine(37)-N6)-threonylcarbamoyltransferase complex ATPase subunit type 1 TsaE [Gammaproteobacteria bacterium]|nr:tRNA (adenosine(37)-N6)-threonylcarbamoyltransferase complex ATPase subunit type 1 TsaE [Gammaproteobacteria bacterium]
MSHSIFLADDAATIAFGQHLGKAFDSKCLLTLSGNLGSGKTTLSRGLIQSYGHSGAVKSPTYTLVEPYEIGDKRIYHFDLYRMEDPEELEFIGLWDYLTEEALIIIEWPEKAFGVLPPADLAIQLEPQEKGRKITCSANTLPGETMLKKLSATDQS